MSEQQIVVFTDGPRRHAGDLARGARVSARRNSDELPHCAMYASASIRLMVSPPDNETRPGLLQSRPDSL
jgi:hypothetical protein